MVVEILTIFWERLLSISHPLPPRPSVFPDVNRNFPTHYYLLSRTSKEELCILNSSQPMDNKKEIYDFKIDLDK